MAGWRSQLRSTSPDIVGRALRRGGGIAKRGSGVALEIELEIGKKPEHLGDDGGTQETGIKYFCLKAAR